MSDTVRTPKAPEHKPTPEQKFAAKGAARNVADANTRLRARVKKVRKFPTRPVAVRLQVRLWEAIDQLAEHFDVDRTAVVKRLFEDGLRRYGVRIEGLLEGCGLNEARKPNPFDAFAQPEGYGDTNTFNQQPTGLMFPVEPTAQMFSSHAIPSLTNVTALPGVVLPQGAGNVNFRAVAPVEEEAAGE